MKVSWDLTVGLGGTVIRKNANYFFDNPLSGKRAVARKREFAELQKGEGTLGNCLKEFILSKINRDKEGSINLKGYCSTFMPKEEKFFDEHIFDEILLQHPHNGRSGNSIMLRTNESSNSTTMSNDEIINVLFGLTTVRIKVIDVEEKDVFTTYSIFQGLHIREETYKEAMNSNPVYDLYINPEFIQICLEGKLM